MSSAIHTIISVLVCLFLLLAVLAFIGWLVKVNLDVWRKIFNKH